VRAKDWTGGGKPAQPSKNMKEKGKEGAPGELKMGEITRKAQRAKIKTRKDY